MWFDAALLACNRKENLGNSVPDIVSYHISNEEHRQPNADNGIDEVQPVGSRHDELLRQKVLYLSDKPLQEQSRKRRKDADQKADEQDEAVVGEVSAPPTKKTSYGVANVHAYFLRICILPSMLSLMIWLGFDLLRSFWRDRIM